jgi:hypothetical protein
VAHFELDKTLHAYPSLFELRSAFPARFLGAVSSLVASWLTRSSGRIDVPAMSRDWLREHKPRSQRRRAL